MKEEFQKYIDFAIAEILHPKLENTVQYLEVNEVEFENGLPKVIRVNPDVSENMAAIFFAIKNERFFLEMHIRKAPEMSVDMIYTENAHRIYFTAISRELNYTELSSMLKLTPLTGWSKEDKRGKGIYGFSRVRFEPIKNEAYGFNEKLNLLLDELEKDAENIITLSQKSNAFIQVVKYQYVSGNAGNSFDIALINRLAKLNIGIDIDTYIVGNPLIS